MQKGADLSTKRSTVLSLPLHWDFHGEPFVLTQNGTVRAQNHIEIWSLKNYWFSTLCYCLWFQQNLVLTLVIVKEW